MPAKSDAACCRSQASKKLGVTSHFILPLLLLSWTKLIFKIGSVSRLGRRRVPRVAKLCVYQYPFVFLHHERSQDRQHLVTSSDCVSKARSESSCGLRKIG